ncbi:hypothetical protein D3C73_1133260 [compost metagenome]
MNELSPVPREAETIVLSEITEISSMLVISLSFTDFFQRNLFISVMNMVMIGMTQAPFENVINSKKHDAPSSTALFLRTK